MPPEGIKLNKLPLFRLRMPNGRTDNSSPGRGGGLGLGCRQLILFNRDDDEAWINQFVCARARARERERERGGVGWGWVAVEREELFFWD